MQPSDTPSHIERLQAELLARRTPAQRVAMAMALTRQARALSWRALRRRHPDASEAELKVMFVELHYGRALAQGVAARLGVP